MSESLKSAMRVAALRILESLAKWLIEAGFGVGDVLPILKTAFVRAARAQTAGHYPVRPNASRISVVTGLTRAEVASILEQDAAEPEHDRGRQRAERVLAGWWNDPAFQDPSGEPAILPLRGAQRSFTALVERYSGERWRVSTLRAELLRVKAVRELKDGRLQVLSRTYATVRWDPDGVISFGEELAEHCATLTHNLKAPEHARTDRRVMNRRVNPKYIPLLRRDLEQQLEALADNIDDTLNDPLHTLTGKGSEEEAKALGVAVYIFEGPSETSGHDEAASAATKAARTHRRPRSSAPPTGRRRGPA
jgi:Family of unknown function (DUF6502)